MPFAKMVLLPVNSTKLGINPFKTMKLLPQTLLKKIPPLYSQPAHDDLEQEMVFYIKLFTPWSQWTWYIAEYDPNTETAWGLVQGQELEYGTFSIDEIRQLKGPFGLKVEREKTFWKTKEKDLLFKIRNGTY
jgi:hypothetical protein